MVAGGTGIAPLRAMLDHLALWGENPKTHLFYGGPAREDLSSVAWRRLEARPTESAISIVHNQLRDLPGLMDTSPAMA